MMHQIAAKSYLQIVGKEIAWFVPSDLLTAY